MSDRKRKRILSFAHLKIEKTFNSISEIIETRKPIGILMKAKKKMSARKFIPL